MKLEDLKHYRAEQLEIMHLLDQLDALNTVIYFPHAQNMDGQPHGSGGNDSLVNIVAKKETLERMLELHKDELLSGVAKVEEEVASMADPLERMIIRLRYMEGLSWVSISDAVNYSVPQCKRKHKQALKHLCFNDDTR